VIGRIDCLVVGIFGRPGQALSDPLGERCYGGLGQLNTFFGHSGNVFGIDVSKSVDDETIRWSLQIDDRAVIATFELAGPVAKLKPDLRFGSGVAIKAVVRE